MKSGSPRWTRPRIEVARGMGARGMVLLRRVRTGEIAVGCCGPLSQRRETSMYAGLVSSFGF